MTAPVHLVGGALAAVALTLMLPAAARAQDEPDAEENPITDAPRQQRARPRPPAPPPPPPPAPPTLVLGLTGGASIPTSNLGPSFSVGVDAAYPLPLLDGRFGLGLLLSFSQPAAAGTLSVDPGRVSSGEAAYEATLRQLLLGPLVTFRLFHWGARWSPHVGAGPAIFFLANTVQCLGQDHTETSLQVGAQATLGADLRLWRGALVGEARFVFATLEQRTTGESNLGAISVVLGYRFRL